jgi:hypothetical protein
MIEMTLLREHGERIATHAERIDNLRRDIDRILKLLETRKEHQWSLSLTFLVILGSLIGTVVAGVVAE